MNETKVKNVDIITRYKLKKSGAVSGQDSSLIQRKAQDIVKRWRWECIVTNYSAAGFIICWPALSNCLCCL